MEHTEPSFQDAVSDVLKETRKYLDDLELIPRSSNVDVDVVLLALLSKSIVVAEATLCLVANGFTDEAFGLCRTAVEIGLTVRYLTNKDTAARCKRFIEFYAKDVTEWNKLIAKYYPDMKPARVNDEAMKRLADAYKSPHKWSECPDGVKGFASEPDSFEVREDGTPLDDNFYYEVLYKSMSQYVHATVSGVQRDHMSFPGDRFRVHPNSSSPYADDSLRISILSVHVIAIRIFRALNMKVPGRVSSL